MLLPISAFTCVASWECSYSCICSLLLHK